MKSIRVLCLILALIFTVVGCERNLTKSPQQGHDIAITGISVLSRGVRDYTVPVVVNLENQGNYGESSDVKLEDITDGIEIGTKSVTFSPAGEGGFGDVANLILTGEAVGNQFGDWLAVGDVNGDGYDDLLITAAEYNKDQGRVYLHYGGEGGMNRDADIILTGENIGDEFGEGDMRLADLNNDGYDDVIIGARSFNNSKGRVYIYYGGSNMDKNCDIIIGGEAIDSRFGHTIVVSDLNNDGHNDLIVGANKYDNYRGRAYLYYGPIASDTTVDKTFTGENEDDTYSHVMSARGDVDGDGFNDLLIGTRFWPQFTNTGRAYLYFGANGTTMDETSDLIFNAENEGDQFASSLDLFDIDNDGFADIIIGARAAKRYSGRGYIYWGSNRATMDNNPDVYFNGDRLSNMGGDSLHCGHVNKDAYGDIIFSGYSYDNGKGRAYLFYGDTKESMNNVKDYTFTGDVPVSFPMRVRVADFKRDNYGDIVIGAWKYNNSQGRVLIYNNEPPSSNDLTFYWDTTRANRGEHMLKAIVSPIRGEKDIADNTMTKTINLKDRS